MYDLTSNYKDDNNNDELLDELKSYIQSSYECEDKERRYFSYFTKMICDTALDYDQITKLAMLNKPAIECNQMEMFINKELGEFMNQQPNFEVKVSDSVTLPHMTDNMEASAEVIEGYLRHELSSRNTESAGFNIYADMIRGSYSVAKVYTDYKNSNSFQQVIKYEKKPYPTMCGFDPLAMTAHKGDGSYCFEWEFYSKKDAIRLFGEDVIKNVSPSNGENMGFTWSFYNNNRREEIYTFCKFYLKEKKKKTIVSLSDGREMNKKQYLKEMKRLEQLEEMFDEFIIMPTIEEERESYDDEVVCYLLNENKIIKKEVTDFKYLPLVKFMGGKVNIQDPDGTNKKIVGRSLVHHLEGQQRLLNTSMQQIGYEIENTMAHKIIMPIESVDLTQTKQLINPQEANVILYNSHREGNSDNPLPPPIIVQRPPVPSIIENAFIQAPMMMQSIMGGMDQMGMQRNNVSGEAMDAGAMQSSRYASPWQDGYIVSLNQVCNIYMDLIPKFFDTPRSIPFMGIDGKRDFKVINDDKNPDSVYMDFDSESFNIEISAGVNAEVAKRISVNQMITMAKMGGWFDEFIVTKCLPEFVANLDVRHQKAFMKKAEEFMAEKQEEKKQQKEQMMKNPPIDPARAQIALKQAELHQKTQVDEIKLQQEQQKIDIDSLLKSAEIKQKDTEIQLDMIKTLMSTEADKAAAMASIQKADAENMRSNVDMAIQISKHQEEVKADKLDRWSEVLKHKDKHGHKVKEHEDKMALEEKKVNAGKNK